MGPDSTIPQSKNSFGVGQKRFLDVVTPFFLLIVFLPIALEITLTNSPDGLFPNRYLILDLCGIAFIVLIYLIHYKYILFQNKYRLITHILPMYYYLLPLGITFVTLAFTPLDGGTSLTSFGCG